MVASRSGIHNPINHFWRGWNLSHLRECLAKMIVVNSRWAGANDSRVRIDGQELFAMFLVGLARIHLLWAAPYGQSFNSGKRGIVFHQVNARHIDSDTPEAPGAWLVFIIFNTLIDTTLIASIMKTIGNYIISIILYTYVYLSYNIYYRFCMSIEPTHLLTTRH